MKSEGGDAEVGVLAWIRAGMQGVAGRSSVFIPLLTLNAIVWAALGVSTLHNALSGFHVAFLVIAGVLLWATLGIYIVVLAAKPDLLRSDHYQVIDRMGQQIGASTSSLEPVVTPATVKSEPQPGTFQSAPKEEVK